MTAAASSRLATGAALAAWLLLAPAPVAADPGSDPAAASPGADPWESLNRGVFAFNEGFDRYLLEPVAVVWDRLLPDPVQTSIRGVYDHLRFPVIVVNDALQLKPVAVAEDIGRFAINSLWGLFGIWDAAALVDLEGNEEDFGQTLGYWGVPSGPYLVLPLLGPSSVRDAAGVAGNYGISYGTWFQVGIPLWASASITVVDVVNRRSLLIEEIREERAAAFDWYVFVRNAYLQNRERRVRDAVETDPETAPEDDLYYWDDAADPAGNPAEPDEAVPPGTEADQ